MTVAVIPNNIMVNLNGKSNSDKTQFPISIFRGRSTASSGLWVAALLPLACCPGFYSIHSQCSPSPCILSIIGIQVGISSLHILYDLYFKEKKSSTQFLKSSDSWVIYFLGHRYLPVVFSCIALKVLNILGPAVLIGALVCCALQHRLTNGLLEHYRDCFSTGECILVGQAGSLAISLSVKGALGLSPIVSENRRLFLFVQVAIIISSLFGYVVWRWRTRLKFWRFLLLLVLFGGIGIGISSLMINVWSPMWLLHMIFSPTRVALVGWWANASVIIVLTAVVSQRYPYVPQTVLRKTFHVLMVFIMVPGIILDPTLTYLASTAAMILFILLEVIRVSRIEPFNSLLNSIFYTFLDEKDGGSLILSHIYLLGGLSLPLWLYPCDFLHTERIQINMSSNSSEMKIQFSVLPLLAGVLAVGIGDTAASVAGTYFGKHKFPGTRKTVEGSLCSFICQVAFVTGVVYLGSMNLLWTSWPRLIFAIAITTLVEAFTNQVDNIVLPLLLYTPLMDP